MNKRDLNERKWVKSNEMVSSKTNWSGETRVGEMIWLRVQNEMVHCKEMNP